MNMGLVISRKNNERRRALLPEHIGAIRNKGQLMFETGYGEALGIGDAEYIRAGAKVETRDEALECDIIVDVKLDSAD